MENDEITDSQDALDMRIFVVWTVSNPRLRKLTDEAGGKVASHALQLDIDPAVWQCLIIRS
jgi:hypothetical protein